MNTNVPAGAVTSINGMRVLSMWWVILGHIYYFEKEAPTSKFHCLNIFFSHSP